jgi:hypothetical protein
MILNYIQGFLKKMDLKLKTQKDIPYSIGIKILKLLTLEEG